jgi:hypothetical protein
MLLVGPVHDVCFGSKADIERGEKIVSLVPIPEAIGRCLNIELALSLG